MDGIEAMRRIVAIDPAARIIALSSYEGEADIARALQAGACGYLLKDTLGTELVGAVRAAAAGGHVLAPDIASRLAELERQELTPREIEVLGLAAKGLPNSEIARAIGRTPETVKAHLRNLMGKLGVSDRAQAVIHAVRRGIIHID
jgi:DNA-binding NarL/FixJ family response regulator